MRSQIGRGDCTGRPNVQPATVAFLALCLRPRHCGYLNRYRWPRWDLSSPTKGWSMKRDTLCFPERSGEHFSRSRMCSCGAPRTDKSAMVCGVVPFVPSCTRSRAKPARTNLAANISREVACVRAAHPGAVPVPGAGQSRRERVAQAVSGQGDGTAGLPLRPRGATRARPELGADGDGERSAAPGRSRSARCGWLTIRRPYTPPALLVASEREQRAHFVQHLANGLIWQSGDHAHVATPPIDALQLVRQDHTRNGQPPGKRNFERVAFDLVRDRTKHRQTDPSVVGCG